MESLRQGLGPAAPTYPLYQKKVVSEQAAQQPTIETGLVCEVGIWKQSESNEKKEDKLDCIPLNRRKNRSVS